MEARESLARGHSKDPLWVDSRGSIAVHRMAGIGAKQSPLIADNKRPSWVVLSHAREINRTTVSGAFATSMDAKANDKICAPNRTLDYDRSEPLAGATHSGTARGAFPCRLV